MTALISAAVYDGRTMLGSFKPIATGFEAKNAAGRKIGLFETARKAMIAVVTMREPPNQSTERGGRYADH